MAGIAKRQGRLVRVASVVQIENSKFLGARIGAAYFGRLLPGNSLTLLITPAMRRFLPQRQPSNVSSMSMAEGIRMTSQLKREPTSGSVPFSAFAALCVGLRRALPG